MSLRKCSVHDAKSFIYCRTCGRVICSRCDGCGMHDSTTIDKLLDKYKNELDPAHLIIYEKDSSILLNNITSKIERCERSLEEYENNVNEKHEEVVSSGERKINDITLMEIAVKYLEEVQQSAFTEGLKDGCKKAIESLNLRGTIENEIGGYPKELVKLEVELDEAKKELKILNEEKELLGKVGNGKTDENKLALVFCLERGVFDYKIDCNISEFQAMKGLKYVFDIENVNKKESIDVGEGIKISEPITVEKQLRTGGSGFFVSLSYQGILSIYSNGKNNIIQFTNLLDNKQVNVSVEGPSNVAFYDDAMILLTRTKPLREANVKDVLDNRNISTFKEIGTVNNVSPYTDTSLLHSRRAIIFMSLDSTLHEYNVDTKKDQKIDIELKPTVFSSLLGVNSGAKAVFQCSDNKFTYVLNSKNETTPLYEVKQNKSLNSIHISATDSENLSKSVTRYSNCCIKEGKVVEFSKPIKFGPHNSIVRLYRDIFLLYDLNINKWVMCRISIP